jgi:excisionase family DNA binding protein
LTAAGGLDNVVVVNDIMDGYVSVNEAARRLGRSIEQVRRYLREGRLPGQRIGGQWFIEEDALAAWHPERRGIGRVSARKGARLGEAVAAYEVRPMKAKETKKFKPLIDPQLLREIDETAKRIHDEIGDVDVVELIRQIREEH